MTAAITVPHNQAPAQRNIGVRSRQPLLQMLITAAPSTMNEPAVETIQLNHDGFMKTAMINDTRRI